MKKVITFLREVRAELAKVVWPPRRKAIRLTLMVVVVTALFGTFIAGVDYGLGKGIKYVIETAGKKSTPAPAAGGQPVKVPVGGNGQGAPVQIPGAPQQ